MRPIPLAVVVIGLVAILQPQRGLAAAEAKPGTNDRNMEFAGSKRTYRLHLPKGYTGDKPLPLVIVMHGAGANGAMTEALTKFSPLADKKNFAVVYPDGLHRLWGYWDDKDPGFIKALAEELAKEGIADDRRVYLTGISNGAYMANVLACDSADRFAAMAAVAGTMWRIKANTARPSRPMPVLYFHGTEDKIVGYDGVDFITKKDASLPAEDCAAWWAKKNGCDAKPVIDKLPDKAKDDTTVERHTYAPTKSGAEVVLYKVIGGGHTWPGGLFQPEQLLGKTSRDIDATELMWEFFEKHRLPAK